MCGYLASDCNTNCCPCAEASLPVPLLPAPSPASCRLDCLVQVQDRISLNAHRHKLGHNSKPALLSAHLVWWEGPLQSQRRLVCPLHSLVQNTCIQLQCATVDKVSEGVCGGGREGLSCKQAGLKCKQQGRGLTMLTIVAPGLG